MRELVVILPDFFSISSDAHGAAASAVALPRLPQLEGLLARATRTALPDWRAWLRERVAGASLSPASTVAAAWGLPADPAHHYWLATPVQLFAVHTPFGQRIGSADGRAGTKGQLAMEATHEPSAHRVCASSCS